MPTIDADAHVIETENTWNYLEGHEAEFRPALLSANRDGREFWLIDGNVFTRSNVNEVADFSVLPEVQKELKLTPK